MSRANEIYNYERSIRREIENIRSDVNAETILRYRQHRVAEGMSLGRQYKCLNTLKLLSKILGKRFKDATKDDMVRLVAEIEKINKAIVELQTFEEQLTKIIHGAGKVQTDRASHLISSSHKDIEDYYTRLCMHGFYDKIRIDVKPREVSGAVKNAYAIKAFSTQDGKETHVATRFSTGQMNCVALSIFFALTKSLPMKLGFIVLDDPSQNLDHNHKDALVDIISAVSVDRQVLISTQDEEFKNLLQSKLANAEFYEFSKWNATGPVIKH